MWNVHWVVLKECLLNVMLVLDVSLYFWLEMSNERYNCNAHWRFKIAYHLHYNLPNITNKSECDVKTQACRFNLFFDLSCLSSFIVSYVFHGIHTRKSNSMPAELLSKLVASGKRTTSSVHFCWKLQWYVLIVTYFAFGKKVPTGTFSSWDQVRTVPVSVNFAADVSYKICKRTKIETNYACELNK